MLPHNIHNFPQQTEGLNTSNKKSKHNNAISRRQFNQAATALAATACGSILVPQALGNGTGLALESGSNFGDPRFDVSLDVSLKGRIWKTLKIGMTNGVGGTLVDRFRAVKEAGFDGIEMDSPGMDVEETRIAIAETGLVVDGTVCATHWQVRHTDPNPDVKKQALADLQQAIQDTDAVGGKSVLLVVGHGRDGSPEQVWERAIENVRLAIPSAARLGISILVENVWNHMMYDHNGGADQTADQFVEFIDQLNSPWVGMQFDIGNHWKYGSMGDWIRQLGRRIYKLDVKGYSRAKQSFTDIGVGDIDWGDVRAALKEINYYGWAAAEVGGGDLERLTLIS